MDWYAGLALLPLAAWLYLLTMRGGFWRADCRLRGDDPAPEVWPDVVAVIPARDEAAVIGKSIASHLASTYPGRLAVFLADDASHDGTADIAQRAASTGRHGLHIITAPPLEPGWSGKLWAMRHGLEAALRTMPDARYILFTDADIVHAPDTLASLVRRAEADDLALVSLMARLDDRGFWGGLLIPAFVFFFQKLYPFARANDPARAVAAAAGGCMLVRRHALEEAGGLEAIRGELIDDCALARLIKGNPPQRHIEINLADGEVVSLRDNRDFRSVWNMVARTAYTQLNHSPLLLLGTLVGMVLLYLVGPVLFLAVSWHGSTLAAWFGLIIWGQMVLAYAPTLTLYGRAYWHGVALPVAGVLYAAMTLGSAIRHWRGRGGQWKGRNYGAGLRTPPPYRHK
jgi:hopene-associated glycosyltransferase HpnB